MSMILTGGHTTTMVPGGGTVEVVDGVEGRIVGEVIMVMDPIGVEEVVTMDLMVEEVMEVEVMEGWGEVVEWVEAVEVEAVIVNRTRMIFNIITKIVIMSTDRF